MGDLDERALAVASLVELLQGEGDAALCAVELLARLKAPEALVPMVRRLLRTEPGAGLHDTLLFALEELGPAVAPAGLEALASAGTPDERLGLLSLLARSGAKDERIYSALLVQLQEDPIQGALNLARYGDPRALEPLRRALEACPVDEDAEDLFANQLLIELEAALVKLGGALDAAQREKVARARRSRQRLGLLFQRVLATLPRGRGSR